MTMTRQDQKLEDAKTRTSKEALKILEECESTPRLAELAQLIQERIGLAEIADMIVNQIQNGSAKEKREFSMAYIDMLTRLEKLQGEVTADDISKMCDETIDAILEHDYQLPRKTADV